jgi:hypothetical protein
MNEKPTYRFEIKAKRTGKKIKHYMNKDDYGFFGMDVSKATDERMKDIALGIVMALMNDKEIYVEVYKLNEQGGYDLIRTQF